MPNDSALRKQLVTFLVRGGHAHTTFDDAVKGFPLDRIGIRPEGASHSAWELLEHLRIAQNDILLFSKSAKHVSPKWPESYWPDGPAPRRKTQWTQSIKSFQADLAAFARLVSDPKRDLNEPFPWGDGQTLLREALLIIDHNSYHLGQLILVRRLLGAWGS